MEKLTGKTALITGATSGIGRELTNLFAKDGYNLVLVARSGDSLKQIAGEYEQQFGVKTVTIAQDLADPKAPEAIYQQTQEQGITINILVNDAGMGEYGKFATETDIQKELDVVQVNAVALMHLTKLYLKDMVGRNEGKILMLGSEVSVIPNPMMAVYGATKAFIKSFSEAIRNELKDTDVTITVLMPGATNTDFFQKAGAAHVKGADPSKTADPADVAKEGYEALMQGKDHVVAGWMNKARVAVSHVLPDPFLAANVRRDMTPADESLEEENKQLTQLIIGASVVVGVLAGLYIAYRQTNALDRANYRYQAGKALYKTRKGAKSVGNSVSDTLAKATSSAGEALTKAAGSVSETVKDSLATAKSKVDDVLG